MACAAATSTGGGGSVGGGAVTGTAVVVVVVGGSVVVVVTRSARTGSGSRSVEISVSSGRVSVIVSAINPTTTAAPTHNRVPALPRPTRT